MNRDTFEGKWHELKGKLKSQWGKLTDDDLAQINGKREELLGRLQKRYGYVKERAEEELRSFERSFDHSRDESASSSRDFAKSPSF